MGAIRDLTASFDIPFIIGGLSFIVSALMHFFLMWIMKREKNMEKTRTTTGPSSLDI